MVVHSLILKPGSKNSAVLWETYEDKSSTSSFPELQRRKEDEKVFCMKGYVTLIILTLCKINNKLNENKLLRKKKDVVGFAKE